MKKAKDYYDMTLHNVALKERVSIDTVRAEILSSINEAKKNDDKFIQEFWSNCPSKNSEPTAAEILEYVSKYIQKNLKI